MPTKIFSDAARASVLARRKKVNNDEAHGIAQLEKESMQVVRQVNGNSFRDATKLLEELEETARLYVMTRPDPP